MGLAISEPSRSDITVSVVLSPLNGQPFGKRGTLTIPAASEVPIFLNQISGLDNLTGDFEGLVRVSTDSAQGISVIGLRGRYNERGDFMIVTMPVVSAEAGSSSDPM